MNIFILRKIFIFLKENEELEIKLKKTTEMTQLQKKMMI